MAYGEKFLVMATITALDVDNPSIAKALIALHRDIFVAVDNAVQWFPKKGLLEALFEILRKSTDERVLALTVSLLSSMCDGCDEVSRRLSEAGCCHFLVNMMSVTFYSGLKQQMLLLHEEAAKLLVNLTVRNRHDLRRTLVALGILPHLADMCGVFHPASTHKDCCVTKPAFSDDAFHFLDCHVRSKKLVAKIYVDDVSPVRPETLNVLTVDLFDATTDTDACVNHELLKREFAWPDPLPTISAGRAARDESACLVQNEKKFLWSDVIITKVIDAHCFWAYVGGTAVRAKAESISDMLQNFMFRERPVHLTSASVGDSVCFRSGSVASFDSISNKWLRGRALKVERGPAGVTAQVLTVDYGFVVKLAVQQLFAVPDIVREIPYQASLCCLRGVQPAPNRMNVLVYTTEIITNLLRDDDGVREQFHKSGGSRALLQLCLVPSRRVVDGAVHALTNLCLHRGLRSQIGSMGGCEIALDLCQKYAQDKGMISSILGLLTNLVVRCLPNRARVARAGGLLTLMKLYRFFKSDVDVSDLVLKCIKNLVVNPWRVFDPLSVPDVRGIVETVDSVRGCFNLANLCGEEFVASMSKRRLARARVRRGAVQPNPVLASFSIDDLRSEATVSSDDCSTSEGYKTGPESAYNEDNRQVCPVNDKPMYVLWKQVDFIEDDRNAIMCDVNANAVKSIIIARSVCAFLNGDAGGTIYFGINSQGRVCGVHMSRKERDNFRLGMDSLLSKFTPSVRHDMYQIKFWPVVHDSSPFSSNSRPDARCIIEVLIRKCSSAIYQTPDKKIYFRRGKRNVEASMQDIREKTIREQEAKYRGEISLLRMSLHEARRQLEVVK